MLRYRRVRIAIVLAVVSSLLGCARFQPVLDQKTLFSGVRIPSVVQTQNGVTVGIEEFASADKSKHAFDSDVVSSGVLPLLFRIDSKSEAAFKMPVESIRAYLDKQPLAVLNGETAAKQATTRDYVGKALGWTILAGPFAIIAWPGTIVGSAMHTNNVNTRIVRHFETLQYQGAMVRPSQPVSGFIYFEIPPDGNILRRIAESKTLQNLTVEIVAAPELEGQSLRFHMPFPSISLSASIRN